MNTLKIDWRSLKSHEEADRFPRMAGLDLKNLAGNIQAKGQLFPIILTTEDEPRILDGRNRLAAYQLLAAQGVVLQPWIETYRGELSPKDYVRAVNWERMHLNGAQRTALAVLMKEDPIIGAQLREEAKARQMAGTSGSIEPNPKDVDTVVAEQMGTSRSGVVKASKVKNLNPEGFQRLSEGTSTVNAEYSKLPTKSKQVVLQREFSELDFRLYLKNLREIADPIWLDVIKADPPTASQRRQLLQALDGIEKHINEVRAGLRAMDHRLSTTRHEQEARAEAETVQVSTL